MPHYQAFVDVSYTWEEGDIEVVTFVVEGKDANDATRNLYDAINEGEHDDVLQDREIYLWDIQEWDEVVEKEAP